MTCLPPSNTVTISGDTLAADEADATYQWLDCDNGYAPISGEKNQNFIPSVSGNFAVEITKDECTAISDCYLLEFKDSIEDLTVKILVYPNPTTGKLTILLNDSFSSDLKVFVINTLGQIMSVTNYTPNNFIDLTIDGVPGIYYVNILSEDIN